MSGPFQGSRLSNLRRTSQNENVFATSKIDLKIRIGRKAIGIAAR